MEEIKTDKEVYLDLLREVAKDRPGVYDLIGYLDTTDFFKAPASSQYHLAVRGGLCKHSLNVYDNMIKLRDQFCPELSRETVILTSLLHDISKTGFYELTYKNKKVYTTNGSKHDELGDFDWQSVPSYKVIDGQNRDLICSEHGVNSYIIISKYVNLTEAERAAIINHHAGMDNGFVMRDLNEAFNRYPALTLLHMADMMATYIQENPYFVNE